MTDDLENKDNNLENKALKETEERVRKEMEKRKKELKNHQDEQMDALKEEKVEEKKKREKSNVKRETAIKTKIEDDRKVNSKNEKPALASIDKIIPNFKKKYLTEVRNKLQKDFSFSSPMQIPRLSKITVSFGCSADKDNKKYMDAAVKELEQITGQHVVRTKAHKSIANFKIRQGQEIGAMVTLRNDNMWYFLERLICIALPRVRDFRGVKPNAFDGRGNYSLGISEQIIFPEIDFDKIERISGFNIAFVTTAKNDKEGYTLLKELGMPFSK